MKLTRLNDWHVVITAHDLATCEHPCEHRVAVVAFPPAEGEHGIHVTINWGHSQGPLGVASTTEFRDGLNAALHIADYMTRVGPVSQGFLDSFKP